MPVAGITHDLTLEDTDGTNKTGLMMWRKNPDARGRRKWQIKDTETIAPRLLTAGAMRQSEFPPAVQLPIFEREWVRGIGRRRQVEVPAEDVHGVTDAAGVVSFDDGRLRLAPKTVEATIDTAPAADKPCGFAVVDTEFWAFIERDVYKWDFTNKQFVKGTQPQNVDVLYKNGVSFSTQTFAPAWNSSGDAGTMIYKADADADWTLQTGATTAPIGGKFAAVARNASNADIFYLAYIKRADGTFGTNRVVSSTNPSDSTTYSTETAIGTDDSPITNLLVGDDNQVFVFKTNGVWTLETDGTVINRTPNFELAPHVDNFKTAFNWNGRILATVAPRGLMELRLDHDSSRYIRRDVSLRLSMPELTKYDNPIVSLFGDDTRLFALVRNTSSYYLLQAELRIIDQVADYRWHNLATFTPTTMTTNGDESLYIEGIADSGSSQTHHRLWIAMTDSDATERLDPHFHTISAIDSDFLRATSGTVDSVRLDAGFPLINKRFEGVDFDVRGTIDGPHTIKIEYSIDDGAYTTWFTLNEDASSREFPPGLAGKVLELRATIVSNDSNTPELHSWRIRTQLQPDPSQIVPVEFYVADGQRLLNGVTETLTNATMTQLRTWNAQAAPVTMRRPDFGLNRVVLFMPGTYQELELHTEVKRRAEYLVSAILLMTGANIDTGLWNQVTWDEFTWG